MIDAPRKSSRTSHKTRFAAMDIFIEPNDKFKAVTFVEEQIVGCKRQRHSFIIYTKY